MAQLFNKGREMLEGMVREAARERCQACGRIPWDGGHGVDAERDCVDEGDDTCRLLSRALAAEHRVAELERRLLGPLRLTIEGDLFDSGGVYLIDLSPGGIPQIYVEGAALLEADVLAACSDGDGGTITVHVERAE